MFSYINDLLYWINLKIKRSKPKLRGFEVLDFKEYSNGILKEVKINNLLNVKTYVYTPKYKHTYFLKVQESKDIHFYLDLIILFPNNTVQQLKFRKCNFRCKFKRTKSNINLKNTKKGVTHRITILKSSKWPNSQGKYITEPLFIGEYDFLGKNRSKNINSYSIPVLDYIVDLLNYRDIKDINFEWEIESYQKQIMSTNYVYIKSKDS